MKMNLQRGRIFFLMLIRGREVAPGRIGREMLRGMLLLPLTFILFPKGRGKIIFDNTFHQSGR
jgi:hypothetical protein